MKDSLFALLLNLFEKTLSQIKETQFNPKTVDNTANGTVTKLEEALQGQGIAVYEFKQAELESFRVLTRDEQIKLTKASYQYLCRMIKLNLLTQPQFERLMNQLMHSDSLFVGLQETKWAIRNLLAQSLTVYELAFLDSILYGSEDGQTRH